MKNELKRSRRGARNDALMGKNHVKHHGNSKSLSFPPLLPHAIRTRDAAVCACVRACVLVCWCACMYEQSLFSRASTSASAPSLSLHPCLLAIFPPISLVLSLPIFFFFFRRESESREQDINHSAVRHHLFLIRCRQACLEYEWTWFLASGQLACIRLSA